MTVAPAALEARGLAKRFGAFAAVAGVDLDLRAGELHALIGPNGAGKSTLLALLAGELRPDAGTVRLGGRDVTALPAHARARAHGLARTFQVPAVLPGLSALDHAALAAQGAARRPLAAWRRAAGDPDTEAPAMVALARCGLQDRAGTPAASLAHGERRALELAMALAAAPKLLLLDEPMAGTGPAEARALTALLASLKPGLPMLLVEHDMAAVWALADRVTVLVGGRAIAAGPPDAVRADAAVRRAYLGEGEPSG